MKVHLYPGSFTPPTFGHADIARRAAALFDNIVVVCSTNPDKHDRLLSESECVRLWGGYDLPTNVRVVTYAEARALVGAGSDMHMIRGIRDNADLAHECDVLWMNYCDRGIAECTILVGDRKFAGVSSSRVRALARNHKIQELHTMVAPLVVGALIERAYGFDNLIMVVGRPGAGKSTLLSEVRACDPTSTVITTDAWSESLKPLLRERLGTDDLVRAATERDAEVSAILRDAWLNLLEKELAWAADAHKKHVFVECAFGLMPTKRLHRYIGGKVLEVHCDANTHVARITERGTPEHLPFLDRIPDTVECATICSKERLAMLSVGTTCEKGILPKLARTVVDAVNTNEWKGGDVWTLD